MQTTQQEGRPSNIGHGESHARDGYDTQEHKENFMTRVLLKLTLVYLLDLECFSMRVFHRSYRLAIYSCTHERPPILLLSSKMM